MKNRSVVAVLLLPFITFGIYSIYWTVSTKIEMNKLGAKIPTAWLMIIPIINIWWMWEYCKGTEFVTKEKMNGILAFVLLWLLGFIGQAIIQDGYNKVGEAVGATAATPAAPAAAQLPETPITSPEAPTAAAAPEAPAAPSGPEAPKDNLVQ